MLVCDIRCKEELLGIEKTFGSNDRIQLREDNTMLEWLKSLWKDPVWSKVISAAILAVIASVWASLKFHWLGRLKGFWKPTLTKANVRLSEQPGKMYPLKYYVELRNDLTKCVEVSLSAFQPDTIELKRFVPTTIQLSLNGSWLPEREGVDRIALLPGQMCRAWIGIDESKFNAAQITRLEGSLGVLVVKVNKKDFAVQL
jgi:hypothetical protein